MIQEEIKQEMQSDKNQVEEVITSDQSAIKFTLEVEPSQDNIPLFQQQQDNSEPKDVTYYFRDSEQSEWSSSEDEIEIDQEKTENVNKKPINKQFFEDQLEEDEWNNDPKGENMKTKNELKPAKYEKEESNEERLMRFGVHFNGSEQLIEIGSVLSVVDDRLVIATQNKSREASQRKILDLDNIIFDEHKQIIGTVEDVFGHIENPFYSLLIDKYLYKLIEQKAIQIGSKMHMIEGYNKILMQVQLEFMLKQKGCDASNRFDEEVLMENEREFSDDEAEQQAKHKKQGKERKQDITEFEDADVEEGLHEENQGENKKEGTSNLKHPKKNKKIMVMKSENGVLKRLFLKPAEFELLKSDPKNRIQQLPPSQLKQQPPKHNNYNNHHSNNNHNNNQYQGNHRNQNQNYQGNRHHNQRNYQNNNYQQFQPSHQQRHQFQQDPYQPQYQQGSQYFPPQALPQPQQQQQQQYNQSYQPQQQQASEFYQNQQNYQFSQLHQPNPQHQQQHYLPQQIQQHPQDNQYGYIPPLPQLPPNIPQGQFIPNQQPNHFSPQNE